MEWIREWRTSWGDRDQLESFARALFHPEITEEEGFLDWFVKERRLAASPAAAVEFARMSTATDITAVLGSIRVPTLVLHRQSRSRRRRVTSLLASRKRRSSNSAARGSGCTRMMWPMQCCRSCAAKRCRWCPTPCWRPCSSPISSARPNGRQSSATAAGVMCSNVTTLMSGASSGGTGVPRSTRLGTGSSAASTGQHERLPARAGLWKARTSSVSRCVRGSTQASARSSARRSPGSRSSPALASRRSPHPARSLVSSTVKDLVAGSGFVFEDRGEHDLKGVPGAWRLYAVA